jgi:electron-transferring-flavoprotein dehydrogenase
MPEERDVLEMDVVFVGAGPASLAGAYHLARLVREHDAGIASGARQGTPLGEVNIAVIEKGPDIGSHGLSGAVLDPATLRELVPDFAERGAPVTTTVTRDDVYMLTKGGQFRLPLVPPVLNNHGNYVISLGRLVAWMAGLCEEAGVNVLPEFPGVSLLEENGAIVGVRTGDKGVDRHGQKKPTYEPGVDLRAKLTILGEGPRGTLTKQLVATHNLAAGRNPQVYSAGIKELWEFAAGGVEQGRVIHTMGFPLPHSTFGGGFIYGLSDQHLSVGFVTGLDYHDPTTDPHGMLQRFKTHPLVARLLAGGKMIAYGAKAIPEGGYYAMPRPYDHGVLLVGDSAGMLNPARLKGIHLAIKSGMLAAETALDALLAGDTSNAVLARYETRIRESAIGRELRSVRLFHQGFRHGLLPGLLNAGLQFATGGRLGLAPRTGHASHEAMQKRNGHVAPDLAATQKRYDNERTFTKLMDIHYSGTRHEEDQPCHLVILDSDKLEICNTRCKEEYGNPCQYFCPANVYEMVEAEDGGTHLQINASNCVHCKTCDIADPYQVITWVPPEGGGGPRYVDL